MWNDENHIDVIVYFNRNSNWGVIAPAFKEKKRSLNHPEHFQFDSASYNEFKTAFHALPDR